MRRNVMRWTICILVLIASEVAAQSISALDRAGITIINGNTASVPAGSWTHFDVGPVIGEPLNAHLFPGIKDYVNGLYTLAETQMTYVIDRPAYLARVPHQGEFMSTAHYVRGMIFFYHATGVGRHRLAKADFENA